MMQKHSQICYSLALPATKFTCLAFKILYYFKSGKYFLFMTQIVQLHDKRNDAEKNYLVIVRGNSVPMNDF